MAKNSGSGKLKIPVEFGNVGIGDQIARIGMTFDRDTMNVLDATEVFVGKRLDVRIVVLKDGEDANQKLLDPVDDARHEIVGVADVKRLAVAPKKFSCGLSFSLESIARNHLFAFAKKSGVLYVRDVTDIPNGAASDDEGDTDVEE